MFLLPWLGHMIAGTTDTVCEVTPRPMGTEEEVSFILATLSEYLAMPVRRSDVTSVWSGIRPLAINPRRAPGSSESTSRDHCEWLSPKVWCPPSMPWPTLLLA